MATIGSIYSKSASNIGGVFSKVKEYYFSMSVATITNALRNAKLPNGAKITKIEIEPHIEIENSVAGNFFFSYGFGSNNSSIGTTLINGAQITKVAMSGSIKPKANITSYMSSLQAPYACSTAYGSYFNFKVHADTIGKRSYWLRSVYLYVTYEVWHTATFKNGETVLQTVPVKSGSTPSYTGATPTSYVVDWQYANVFSGWDKALSAITSDTTYTAQFTPTLRKYNIVRYDQDDVPEGMPISGFGTYYYNDTVTLTPEPPQHIEVFWKVGGITEPIHESPLTFKLDDETLSKWDISSFHPDTLESYIYFNVFVTYKKYNVRSEIIPENGGAVKLGIPLGDGNILWGTLDAEWEYPYNDITIKAIPNKGYKFIKWWDGLTDDIRTAPTDGNYIYTAYFKKLEIKFKGVKILHHSTNEVASPTNPLIGGEDQAIMEIKIALE